MRSRKSKEDDSTKGEHCSHILRIVAAYEIFASILGFVVFLLAAIDVHQEIPITIKRTSILARWQYIFLVLTFVYGINFFGSILLHRGIKQGNRERFVPNLLFNLVTIGVNLGAVVVAVLDITREVVDEPPVVVPMSVVTVLLSILLLAQVFCVGVTLRVFCDMKPTRESDGKVYTTPDRIADQYDTGEIEHRTSFTVDALTRAPVSTESLEEQDSVSPLRNPTGTAGNFRNQKNDRNVTFQLPSTLSSSVSTFKSQPAASNNDVPDGPPVRFSAQLLNPRDSILFIDSTPRQSMIFDDSSPSEPQKTTELLKPDVTTKSETNELSPKPDSAETVSMPNDPASQEPAFDSKPKFVHVTMDEKPKPVKIFEHSSGNQFYPIAAIPKSSISNNGRHYSGTRFTHYNPETNKFDFNISNNTTANV